MLAIIGDQFDNCRSKVEDSPKGKSGVSVTGKSEDGSEGASEWPEICGCTQCKAERGYCHGVE